MIVLRWLLFAAVAAAVLLLPGALLARRSRMLWDRLEPGERILPAFLLSVGSAGVAYVVASLVRPTAGFLVGAWLVLAVALAAWNVAADRRARRSRGRGGVEGGDGANAAAESRRRVPGGGRSSLWALPVVVAGFVAMLYEGGALGVIHDSLEFVAFVKRMLLTSRIDLVSGAFRDVADLGPDPRRGVFHFLAVILCRLSGASAVEMWRWLPATLVPLALWTFYAGFRRVLQSAAAALAALVVFFVATLFSGQAFLNNLAYASRVGWVYSWVGLWAAAVYLDATERRSGSGRERAGILDGSRAAYLLAVLAAPILLGVHVYSAAQYLVALGACAWSWSLLTGLDRRVRRNLLLLPLWALLATAPLLWLKVRQSYSGANPLFGHAQGLLYLAGDWAILSPSHLKSWFGWPGLLAFLLSIPLARGFRRARDRAFLAGSTFAVVLIVLDPVAVRIVELAGAHSILFRILLVAPWFQVLGWQAARALGLQGAWVGAGPGSSGMQSAGAGANGTAGAAGGSPGNGGGSLRVETRVVFRRAWRTILLAVIVAGLALQVRSSLKRGDRLSVERNDWAEFPAVQHALHELERIEPEPAVVVSDPLSSYLVPAFSRHYAIAPFGQHSSPADARTVERIQDARAVLNPIVSMEETVRLLRKYDAAYVLLNQTVRTPLPFYYAPIDPGVYAAQREKFQRWPDLFRPVTARDEVLVFRFLDPGPEWRDTATAANPYRVLGVGEEGRAAPRGGREIGGEPAAGGPPVGSEIPRRELAARLGVLEWPGPAVGGVELIGVDVDSLPAVRRGEPLVLTTYWRRTGDPYVLPVAAFVRMQTEYPDPRFYSPILGRLSRAWYESRHWVAHRFGRDLEPLGAEYPAFLWEAGAVYRVPLTLPVLVNAKPGRYSIGIQVHTIPFEPNLRLRDLFTLRDSREGTRVGEVEVVP